MRRGHENKVKWIDGIVLTGVFIVLEYRLVCGNTIDPPPRRVVRRSRIVLSPVPHGLSMLLDGRHRHSGHAFAPTIYLLIWRRLTPEARFPKSDLQHLNRWQRDH